MAPNIAQKRTLPVKKLLLVHEDAGDDHLVSQAQVSHDGPGALDFQTGIHRSLEHYQDIDIRTGVGIAPSGGKVIDKKWPKKIENKRLFPILS